MAVEGCGGPIEDLVLAVGRDLAAAEVCVSVLTGDRVEDRVEDRIARVANCFVGDFAGDCGDDAFGCKDRLEAVPVLCLWVESVLALLNPAVPETMLLWGRPLLTVSLAVCLSARPGCSRTLAIPTGRRNMPCSGLHSKYRSPATEPSFFPLGPSSSTPTQTPSANRVVPT